MLILILMLVPAMKMVLVLYKVLVTIMFVVDCQMSNVDEVVDIVNIINTTIMVRTMSVKR